MLLVKKEERPREALPQRWRFRQICQKGVSFCSGLLPKLTSNPFSTVRESVLSYDSTSGPRSLKKGQPELGACILDVSAEKKE
jgi:hypothetical protein